MASQSSGSNPQVEQARQLFNSLSQGRKIALIAAAVGLVFSFFPWYSVSVNIAGFSSSGSESGWHGWGWVAMLCFIAAGALILLPVRGISLRSLIPSLPPTVTDARLVLGAGGVGALAVILFMLREGSSTSGPGYSAGPSIGAYVGLLCALAIAAGGYLMQQESTAR